MNFIPTSKISNALIRLKNMINQSQESLIKLNTKPKSSLQNYKNSRSKTPQKDKSQIFIKQQQITFKPNKKSLKLLQQKGNHIPIYKRTQQQLINRKNKLMKMKGQLEKQNEQEELSFQPQINRENGIMERKRSWKQFIKYQEKWNVKKEQKLLKERRNKDLQHYKLMLEYEDQKRKRIKYRNQRMKKNHNENQNINKQNNKQVKQNTKDIKQEEHPVTKNQPPKKKTSTSMKILLDLLQKCN